MTIKLPDEASDLLDQLEKSDWPESTRLRLLAAGFEPDSREVERLRASMHDELLTYAKDVFSWCNQLVNNPQTTRIWKVCGQRTRLMIYWAKYFNGRPLPKNDASGRSRLLVARVVGAKGRAVPILWYEEQYKWFPATLKEIRDPHTLVQTVHPRFLKKLREHLAGPHCWRWVIQDLQRRLPPKKD